MFLQPSQKRLLASLNPVFSVGLALFLIVIVSTGKPWFASLFFRWDLLLPFVIYFSQRRSLAEGLILTLFLSHLYSLSSSAPIGVFATHYIVLFLLSRLFSYAMDTNTWFSIGLLSFVLYLISRVNLTIVASFFEHGWPLFAFKNWSPTAILITPIFSILIFLLLEKLDQLTFKSPPTNIELRH